jgi:hypothetical protein
MSKLLININNNNSPLNNINSIEKEKNKENEENLTLSKSTTAASLINSSENSNLIEIISFSLLEKITKNKEIKNYKEKIKSQKKSLFTSKKIPNISIGDYLARIKKFTNINDSTLIICLIYLDRYLKMNKIILTEFNVHRLFFSSLLIAIKYNEDYFYTNKFYSNVSGLKCSELNKLELKFSTEIKFDLFVDKNLYEKYKNNL